MGLNIAYRTAKIQKAEMEPMKRVWLGYPEAVVRPVTTTDVGTTLPVPTYIN